jgi:putative redox protein
MPPEIVRLEWVKHQEFILRDRFDFPIVMTQPAGVNGADLLPLSIIGCSTWDIIAILLKQKQPVDSFSVQAASELEAQSPWRFLPIHITYYFTGTNLDEAKIRRAIFLTEEKYCSTFATLRQTVQLKSDFEILPSEH